MNRLLSLFRNAANSNSTSFSETSISSSCHCNQHVQVNQPICISDKSEKTIGNLPLKKWLFGNGLTLAENRNNDIESANNLSQEKLSRNIKHRSVNSKKNHELENPTIIVSNEEDRTVLYMSFTKNQESIYPYKIQESSSESEQHDFPSENLNNDKLIDEMLVNKIRDLKLDDANESKCDILNISNNIDPPNYKSTSVEETIPEKNIKPQKLAKKKYKHKEITMQEYYKYVATKNIFRSLIKKQCQNGNNTAQNKVSETPRKPILPRRKSLGSNKMLHCRTIKSNIITSNPGKGIQNGIGMNEEIKDSSNNSMSLEKLKDLIKKSENSNGDILNTKVPSLNTVGQPSSLIQLKVKSKSAISSLQRIIGVPFDRGKFS